MSIYIYIYIYIYTYIYTFDRSENAHVNKERWDQFRTFYGIKISAIEKLLSLI